MRVPKVPQLMLHVRAISTSKYPRIVGKTLWPFRENTGCERKAPWSFDPRSVALGMFEARQRRNRHGLG